MIFPLYLSVGEADAARRFVLLESTLRLCEEVLIFLHHLVSVREIESGRDNVRGSTATLVVSLMNEAGVLDLMPLLYGAVGFLTTLGVGLILGFGMRAQDGELAGLTIWTQKKK